MSPALDLGHLNALNDDVVVEVDVEEALKSSIFIVQKAAAPKSGVEFRQESIGTIINSLARSEVTMEKKNGGGKIMMKIVATNVVAGLPTARANIDAT